MGSRHAIVVFPRFETSNNVERVRREFDPLAGVIAAHITLAFPFECLLSPEQLHDHMLTAIEGVAPFSVTLSEATVAGDGYLFLYTREGSQQLAVLHRRLYSGPLAQHLSSSHTYAPHVTVGRLQSQAKLDIAARRAGEMLGHPPSGFVESISVFRVDEDDGAVELTVPFR